MAAEFHLRILSSDQNFYEGPCVGLTLPGLDGQLGVLAHHSRFVTAVVPGLLEYRLPEGEARTAVVSHGLALVEGESVLVMVDSAERPEEIDAARARRSEEKAREQLLHKQSWQEYLQTQASLSRAMNRLKAADRKV